MKAAWIGERAHAEWAWSASGSPGPSVGWVRLREITIIQQLRGKRGKCAVRTSSLYSPAWMWPAARGLTAACLQLYSECGFQICSHLEHSPSVINTVCCCSALLGPTSTDLQEWYKLTGCLNCQLTLELLKVLSSQSLMRVFLWLLRQGSPKVIISSQPFITLPCKVSFLVFINEYTIWMQLPYWPYSTFRCALQSIRETQTSSQDVHPEKHHFQQVNLQRI